jgi:hypothetical protein
LWGVAFLFVTKDTRTQVLELRAEAVVQAIQDLHELHQRELLKALKKSMSEAEAEARLKQLMGLVNALAAELKIERDDHSRWKQLKSISAGVAFAAGGIVGGITTGVGTHVGEVWYDQMIHANDAAQELVVQCEMSPDEATRLQEEVKEAVQKAMDPHPTSNERPATKEEVGTATETEEALPITPATTGDSAVGRGEAFPANAAPTNATSGRRYSHEGDVNRHVRALDQELKSLRVDWTDQERTELARELAGYLNRSVTRDSLTSYVGVTGRALSDGNELTMKQVDDIATIFYKYQKDQGLLRMDGP